MSLPLQSGAVDYSSAGIGKFIPEIWSAKLVQNLYDATIFGSIANTDYEGEIKGMGNRVFIRTTPDITIRSYQKGQNLVLERPNKASLTLTIDQGDYFSCVEDDVDKLQSDINLLDTWSKDASTRMKMKMDRALLEAIAFGAQTANLVAANVGATAGRISGNINLGAVGAPVQLTKVNVLDFIINLGVVLDEQNVPEDNRWLILPAWACGMIKKSDLKDASLAGDGQSIARNGRIGMVDRFMIYMSNQVPSQLDSSLRCFHIFCGHKMGLTFATQMTEMESLRAESTFGTIIRGLQVYGFQITNGLTLARLYAFQ